MVLANPGQLAELGFITCEFFKIGTSPILSVLLDEVADVPISISAASQSGNQTTYTYTTTSPYTPVVGDYFTITGMADAGNNGTFIVNTTGAGIFTVTNPNGVTHSGQSGSGTNFESLAGYIAAATGLPPQDAPLLYGLTLTPTTLYANRYYFAQSIGTQVPPHGVSCRSMQVRIDYGSTDTVQNELLTMTVFGKHWQEP